MRRIELRLGSSVRRLGAAMGLNAGATGLPAVLGSALQLQLESGTGQLFTDAGGTTPVATTGDLVARRNDLSGNARHRTQASSGSRPTYLSTGPAVVYTGSSLMSGGAVTLAGAYTLYAVGTRSTLTAWVPFGNSAADHAWMVFSDNNFYFIAGSQGGSYTGATGLILARWRRNAAGSVYFAATGMAEVQAGAGGAGAGTFSTDTEGERPGASQFTANNNDHRASIVVSDDTVTAGTDPSVTGYLKTLTGVTWP